MPRPLSSSEGVTLSLLDKCALAMFLTLTLSKSLNVVERNTYPISLYLVGYVQHVYGCIGYNCWGLSVMCFFPLRLEQYELLSDIQEIRGFLRIDGWEGVSFPYLRNLKIIGSQNGTKFTTTCGTGIKRKTISC